MVAKRIIPCLDVKDGVTVKGVNFEGLKEVGDAVTLGARYASEGADELVYLDISATREGRRTFIGLVEKIAGCIDIPFTVGGGISDVETAARLLDAGADKISINSAAVRTPQLITEIASRYGSQFVVVAIDAKCIDGIWRATTHGGSILTDLELCSWAHEAQERGAGEILFTSMDHDGTFNGYPCEVYARLAERLSIPVIASGGAGSVEDIADVPYRVDDVVLFAQSQLLAKAADVGLHHGRIRIDPIPPDMLDNRIRRHRPARVPHQQDQELLLPRRELDDPSVASHLLSVDIDDHSRPLEDFRFGHRRQAAGDCPQSHDQLVPRDRLGEKVIRAHLESRMLLGRSRKRAQDDQVCSDGPRPCLADDVLSVLPPQPDVDEGDVIAPLQELRAAAPPRHLDVALKPAGLHRARDMLRLHPLVFYNQHSHGFTSLRSSCPSTT